MGKCQWGMRQSAELENQMISFERVLEYAETPSEPALETKNAELNQWPQQGNISFKSLNFTYDEKNSQTILQNLTFHIEAKVRLVLLAHSLPI